MCIFHFEKPNCYNMCGLGYQVYVTIFFKFILLTDTCFLKPFDQHIDVHIFKSNQMNEKKTIKY